MSEEWFFTAKGTQAGPVDWNDLRELAIAGQVKSTDMVWCEGMPEWVPASEVNDLFESAAPARPRQDSDSSAQSISSQPAGGASAIQPTMADAYYQAHASTIYAGFWLRFFAFVLDLLLLGLILIPILIGFMGLMAPDPTQPGTFGDVVGDDSFPAVWLMLRLIIVIVGWLYFAYQESSGRQATLGKRALGLIVTDTSGHRISFAKASGRHFAKIVSQFTFLIGYIMAGTTERKQALHDMLSKCVVVLK